MEVTAQMVKDLRGMTGAGIMDCKEALREKEGNLEEAVRILREKGLSSAAKKAGREASDGLVDSWVSADGRSGILVEVNCETDFVAKTEDFTQLVKKVIRHVEENGGNSLPPNPRGESIQEEVIAAIAKLGENIIASRGERYTLPEGQAGTVCSYIHPGGSIGVMVEVRCGSADTVARAEFTETAKDLAMHIAASSPLYMERDQVPKAVIESERAILMAQSKNTGKPEKIVEKIVDGRINKYVKEVCMMEQPFVKNSDQTIQDWLSSRSKELDDSIEVFQFSRFKRGESSGQGESK